MRTLFLLPVFLFALVLTSEAQNGYNGYTPRPNVYWNVQVGGQVGNYPGYPAPQYPQYPQYPQHGGNCPGAYPGRYMSTMSDYDFQMALQTLSSETFDHSRLSIANQIISSRYLYSYQVKAMMETFTFDRDRLSFAKRAYYNTLDPGNYYIVNSAFTFSSSARELSQSIGQY